MSTLATLATVRRSWDADAGAYLTAVESADQQQLEPAVAQAINQFVLGCKSDGVWTPIKACCILMGARTLTGALTALVGTAPTNTNFVSGDYARKTGLKGNGSNKYLSTGRANNADPQNSSHMAVYVHTAPTANGSHLASGAGVTGGNQIAYDTSAGLLVRNRRISGIGSTISGQNPTGFVGHSRAASATYTVRYSSANTTVTLDSEASSTGVIRAFDIPGFGGYTSNGRLAFYSIGESLTLASLDTRVSNLYTAIGNAIA